MVMTDKITTPCGEIQGLFDEKNQVNIFRGIRFATAKRFTYPKEVTHWEGTYVADTFGPAAFQESAFCVPDPDDFYQKEFYNGERLTYSEDCLFLNIWTPAQASSHALPSEPVAKMPVLVYVHGGAFDHGYSYEKPFDGTEYCKRGVIVVTISYRLSVFGYLALPEFADAKGHYGNYALFDLKTALEWIRHNIASFGGDPGNVTLSGQSAGAMSVQTLCVSPLTDGLFQKAFLMSGGGVGEALPLISPLQEQEKLSRKLMELLGLRSAEELRDLDPKALILGFLKLGHDLGGAMRFCIPTIDGYFLPKHPFQLAKEGKLKDIPYILGTTSEDILPDVFHPAARSLTDRISYVYYFSRQLPGDDAGAWHSSDLWYFFGTLDKCWRPFTAWDHELAASYMDYVANFVKTGDPNLRDSCHCPKTLNLPIWNPYRENKCVLYLGNERITASSDTLCP